MKSQLVYSGPFSERMLKKYKEAIGSAIVLWPIQWWSGKAAAAALANGGLVSLPFMFDAESR